MKTKTNTFIPFILDFNRVEDAAAIKTAPVAGDEKRG